MASRKFIAIGTATFLAVLLALVAGRSIFDNQGPFPDPTLSADVFEEDVVELSSVVKHPDESQVTAVESDPIPSIGRPLDEFDNEFQSSAIAAVDRYMGERQTNHPNGWVRWRGLVISPDEFTNGDYLDPDKVVKRFQFELFPGESYVATQSRFIPRDFIAASQWVGKLDGGDSGTIKVSMQGNEVGPPTIFIRLRTPTAHYTVMPTDVNDVYVVAQGNDAYWAANQAN